MTTRLACASFAALLLGWFSQPTPVWAQSAHSDLRFWYDEGKVQIETDNGLNVGVGDFATTALFRQYEANPGFASELDASMGVNPGDAIVYDVLDPLWYWDGDDFAAPDADVQIRIGNNAGPDTIVSGSTGLQAGSSATPLLNFVANASAVGDFHSHVEYFLEPYDPSAATLPGFGVYGLKLGLSTNAADISPSDPFFFVFNFGLSFADFDTAVAAYAAALDTATIAGDYDSDGDVDPADYEVWSSEYGMTQESVGFGADGNGDAVVDAADYTVWRDALRLATVPMQTATRSNGIPEPAAMLLALSAAGTIALRNRLPCFGRDARSDHGRLPLRKRSRELRKSQELQRPA